LPPQDDPTYAGVGFTAWDHGKETHLPGSASLAGSLASTVSTMSWTGAEESSKSTGAACDDNQAS
jgi:hypothetical protein